LAGVERRWSNRRGQRDDGFERPDAAIRLVALQVRFLRPNRRLHDLLCVELVGPVSGGESRSTPQVGARHTRALFGERGPASRGRGPSKNRAR
jgi:hypothetical protein